jgi:hypothetical protein
MITLFYRRVPAECITANGEVKLGFALIERSWLMKFRRFLQ